MRHLRILSLLAAAMVTGCESDPTEPRLDATVDAVLSQMASNGIASYATTGAVSVRPDAPRHIVPADGSSASCAYDSVTTFFVCPTVATGSITISRSFQLLGTTGAPLSTSDPSRLAAIRSIVDASGSSSIGSGNSQITSEFTRHDDATVSGLLSGSRLLNGKSILHTSSTGFNNTMVTKDTSITTGLILPTSATPKYPLGGTIVTQGTAVQSGFANITAHHRTEIVFDGTNVMTVRFTSGTTAKTCKVDLAAPGVAPVCS